MNLGQMLPMMTNLFKNNNNNPPPQAPSPEIESVQNCYPNTYLDGTKSDSSKRQQSCSCQGNSCQMANQQQGVNQGQNNNQNNNQNSGQNNSQGQNNLFGGDNNMLQNMFQGFMSGNNPLGGLMGEGGGLGNIMSLFNSKSGGNGANMLSSLFGKTQNESEVKNKSSLKKISEFKKVDEINLD